MIKDAKDTPPSFGARQNIKNLENDDREKSPSFLKRGDLSMIFIGAGIITVIVFLMLFRSDKDKSVDSTTSQVEIQALGDRIQALETLVASLEKKSEPKAISTPSLDSYTARVERVEAALSMKFDLVAARLSVLEKKIEGFERSTRVTTKADPAPKAVPAPSVKKAVSKPEPQKSTAGTVTHTVKKGETLYGISREYKTTVAKLRALNNMPDTADIFAGEILVVKP